jgi:hypothetical protein
MEVPWLACQLRLWAFYAIGVGTNGFRAAETMRNRESVRIVTVRSGTVQTRKSECPMRTSGTRSPQRCAKLANR